jgi:hypothetical protein
MKKKIIATAVALVGLLGLVGIASADECHHGNNAYYGNNNAYYGNNGYYAPSYVAPAAAYYPPAPVYVPPPVVRPVYRAPYVRVYQPVRRWHRWGRRW